MHFFRKSKIHLDVFTNRRNVMEYAPVVNGIEVIPTWWKNLPKQFTSENSLLPIPTMKTCVGVQDYYNKSVALPLWSELHVNVEGFSYNWQFADESTRAEVHNSKEYEGILPDQNFGHLKINSPWLFSTKEDLNWVYTQPIYDNASFADFCLAQGVLNFKYQNTTSLQLFINLETNRTFTIPFRTTFLLTPMTDKKIVIHRHLITDEQYASKEQLAISSVSINKYKTHSKLPKCPYKDYIK